MLFTTNLVNPGEPCIVHNYRNQGECHLWFREQDLRLFHSDRSLMPWWSAAV